jgi:hypothetical protein
VFSGDDTALGRSIVALLVLGAILVVSGVAIGTVASGASGGPLGGSADTSGDGAAVGQRNPSDVGGGSSLSAVERRLADRAASRLESGSYNLSREQYDQIQSSLDDSEYESLLDRYSEVADETGNENRSAVLRETRDRQRAYAIAAQRYWRLYAVYNGTANLSSPTYQRLLANLSYISANETLDNATGASTQLDNTSALNGSADGDRTDGETGILAADATTASTATSEDTTTSSTTTSSADGNLSSTVRQNGSESPRAASNRVSAAAETDSGNQSTGLDLNTTQRRQLARSLDRRWYHVEENGTRLIKSYQRLGNVSEQNYTNAIASIRESRQNVTEAQQEVRDEYLTVVTLTATTAEPNGSFTDPIIIAGRLTRANGTALSSESVQLQINGRPYRVESNRSGHFEVAYRPTTLALNETNATVRFDPAADSPYTRAETNVSVAVEQVEPAVAVEASPTRVGFNESLTVFGRVERGDAGAGSVPYLVTIDGQFVARNTTRTNGTFKNVTSVPAAVPPGTQDVRVSLLLDGQALAATNGSTTVQIEERPSNLSVSVDAIEGRSVQVSGRLSVPGAGGVSGQQVRLRANNTTLGTATTGEGGQFQTTVVVPETLLDGGLLDRSTTLSIRAVYANEQSNLLSSEATTTATLTRSPGPVLAGAVVLIVGIVLVGGYAVYSRRGSTSDSQRGVPSPGSTGGSVLTGDADQAAVAEETLLSRAREELAAGRSNAAAQFAYAVVRRRSERAFGIGPTKTPWEFYSACQQHADGDVDGVLRHATELYERAVFASESVSAETVREVLDRIETNEPADEPLSTGD